MRRRFKTPRLTGTSYGVGIWLTLIVAGKFSALDLFLWVITWMGVLYLWEESNLLVLRRRYPKIIKKGGWYYDIWEVEMNNITNQYYKYYIYMWYSWHELELRVIWLISLRIIIIGI